MRVGVVPMLYRSWGGVYQYSVTLLHGLTELRAGDEFVIFVPKGLDLGADVQALPFEMVKVPGSTSVLGTIWSRLPEPAQAGLQRFVALVRRRRSVSRSLNTSRGRRWSDWFARFDLDLLLFTIEDDRSYRAGVPYIVVVHDLQHKLQPDLPEFADRVEWERRERRMRNSVEGATLVLVDSETGREDLVACYGDTGVRADDVWPLPFVPAHYLGAEVSEETRRRVRQSYDLPESYLFYPAQFWPHKNHKRIVEALGLLAREGLRIPLVLVGSSGGSALRAETFAGMMSTARDLNVEDLVTYLGYVPDSDVSALYAQATALIMPTFFGPTNIPVVEAWGLDCPVVTSDIRGIREQVGDAAVLVDPSSVESIAGGIRRVVEDEALRHQLVERGRGRLAAYTMEDFVERLDQIIQEAKRRVAL